MRLADCSASQQVHLGIGLLAWLEIHHLLIHMYELIVVWTTGSVVDDELRRDTRAIVQRDGPWNMRRNDWDIDANAGIL